MLNKQDVIKLFTKYLQDYDATSYDSLWARQSETFKRFWRDKVMDEKVTLKVPKESDPIVRLLDLHARGHKKDDVSVANLYVYQNRWDDTFREMDKNEKIRKLLDNIFKTTDIGKKSQYIDQLHDAQKLGLTGARGNAINGLLFLNDPKNHCSVCSLDHRSQIFTAFGMEPLAENITYGQKITMSNEALLTCFKEIFGSNYSPRTISTFLYSDLMKMFWLNKDDSELVPVSAEEVEATEKTHQFLYESHLQDYIFSNWDSLKEFSDKYEFIERDGENVSLEYRAGKWEIDILVRDKKTKQYVVIELKKGKSADEVVGQMARYIGWVKENLANGKEVKGIIVTSESDEKLKCAIKAIPGAELFVYRVKFEISKDV